MFVFKRTALRTASWRLALVALLAGAGSCVEPYAPQLQEDSSLLVVNGYINSRGVTTITLARAVSPTSTQALPAETRALVSIQSEAGVSYPLSEGAAGTYTSAALSLDPAQRYRLHLTTGAGRSYESALNPVKNAPPIDQVHWRYDNTLGGVRILVDSHDDARTSTYYRWQFTGTWQFTSLYEATLQTNPTTKLIEYRKDDIYHCWRTEASTTIQQASTAGLARDAVLDYPLTFLPVASEQLRYKYSVLVREFTETAEEYAYWEELRKSSQATGSLNDQLPGNTAGNVRCLEAADEVVLGYVGVHGTSEKRIFISSTQVPQVALVTPDRSAYGNCKTIQEDLCPGVKLGVTCPSLPPLPATTQVFNVPNFMVYALTDGRYFSGSTPECVDCRLRGTNVKPSFWQ